MCAGARIRWTVLAILGLLLCFWVNSPTPSSNRESTPYPPKDDARPAKVILVTVDTLRSDRLECYGYDKLKTPNINRLAAEGTRFANAITQVPLTLPSHCSILTGTYPVFHGVRDQAGFYLSVKRTTLAKLLKAQGFATAAFVSAFVLDSRFGLNQGFDDYDDLLENSPDASANEPKRRGDQTLSRALRWMEKYGGSNFFAWLHFYDPHAPYAPPEPFRTRYAQRPYDGEVAFVDSLIGELIRYLEKKGWYSETLVVFTADHGEDLGDHGENTHGFFVYDSTLRIPLIFKLPGGKFAGKVIGEQVESVDIAPTILQILSLPPDREMQGRSLLSLIMQKTLGPRPGFGETYYPYYHFGWSPLRFLRTEKFKYIEAPNPELYDLRQDSQETKNLFSTHRTTAEELKKQLLDAVSRFGAGGAPSAPMMRIDEATREKLRSLGYVGYAPPRQVSGMAGDRQLADPKEKLGIYNRLQSALLDEQNHRLQQAIRKYRELTQIDGNLIDARIHLGLCYKRLGQYEGATEQFKKALQSDPESATATYNLAHTYALAGKTDAAISGFERTLQLDPHEARAHIGLGIAYQLKGDLERAVAEYRRALEINPSDPMALSNLGAALLSQQNTDEAIAYLKRALTINPDNAETHNTLGAALLMKDNLTEAMANFRQAIDLNADYAEAHANLGLALVKKGSLQEGISSLKRALEINPSSGYAHYLLGQAYAAQGSPQAAETEFQVAKRLGYR